MHLGRLYLDYKLIATTGRVVSLPEFNNAGDLPSGVYKSLLADVGMRFGKGSDRRKLLMHRLERIHQIALHTGYLARFVVFGSFITDKLEPNDVDVFMIMDDNFEMGLLTGEPRLLFADHGTAQDYFGASVFWMRRMAAIGGEQAAIEDWQIKRDGTERGIVEITAE